MRKKQDGKLTLEVFFKNYTKSVALPEPDERWKMRDRPSGKGYDLYAVDPGEGPDGKDSEKVFGSFEKAHGWIMFRRPVESEERS